MECVEFDRWCCESEGARNKRKSEEGSSAHEGRRERGVDGVQSCLIHSLSLHSFVLLLLGARRRLQGVVRCYQFGVESAVPSSGSGARGGGC